MLSEVDWTLDQGDGRKLVCINLEKRLPDTPYSESLRASADTAPLFDSLRIGGREVGTLGPTLTLTSNSYPDPDSDPDPDPGPGPSP